MTLENLSKDKASTTGHQSKGIGSLTNQLKLWGRKPKRRILGIIKTNKKWEKNQWCSYQDQAQSKVVQVVLQGIILPSQNQSKTPY
jgi:hypothetical protein